MLILREHHKKLKNATGPLEDFRKKSETRSEVRGKWFAIELGLALQQPLVHTVICEWHRAGPGASEDEDYKTKKVNSVDVDPNRGRFNL